jgi:hypothetical protein
MSKDGWTKQMGLPDSGRVDAGVFASLLDDTTSCACFEDGQLSQVSAPRAADSAWHRNTALPEIEPKFAVLF